MRDAPERIWKIPATSGGRWVVVDSQRFASDVEYVRADLFNALKAENERLRALIEEAGE